MPDIRYVCLSDLHFGAENSLLTRLEPGTTRVDPSAPSACLVGLVDCLADLLGHQDPAPKPSLVLNGDVLELALAPDNQAAMAFERFVERAFPTAGSGLFDDTILYVPGNHDHHLWETARERQYARYVADVPAGTPLEAPWHVTRLFPAPGEAPLQSELLTTLLREHLGRAHLTVQTAYPNFGVEFAEGVVVFHHGHFVESLYRLLTYLRRSLFPASPVGPDVWDWEADNFAWIDFFWSTLGRSGQAGEDVGLVYDMLQKGEAVEWLLDNLAHSIGERAHHPWAGRGIGLLLRLLARRLGPLERRLPTHPLSPGAETGLREYLAGPLARQLDRERPGVCRSPVTFVFGHTHKPFERSAPVPGYDQPVTVANTGGWVIDTLEIEALQGAAVVLVDGRGEAASLRMYQQADDAASYRVAVNQVGSGGDFAAAIRAVVDPDSGPWAAFSRTAAAAVVERREALGRIIDEAIEKKRAVKA